MEELEIIQRMWQLMDDFYILDDDDNPILCKDVKVWAAFLKKSSNKLVSKTKIPPSKEATEVSTVFLGMEHGERDGKPLLWETLVFGGPFDEEMERYASKQEAIEGHLRMVDKVRGKSGDSS
jgi:hypothetical protein